MLLSPVSDHEDIVLLNTPLGLERMINRLVLLVLISKSDEEPKAVMKTKSNYGPNGTVTIANDSLEWNCNNLHWNMFKSYLVRNYFYFSIYFLFCSDMMFTVVCTIEILYEYFVGIQLILSKLTALRKILIQDQL